MRNSALVLVLAAVSCPAEFLRIEYEVGNMDCMSCVRSLDSKFRRMRGVTKAKVDGENGSAVLELAPNNKVTLERIRDDIKGAGFTPKSAKVVLKGKPVTGAGKWRIEVSVINQSYAMTVSENLVTEFVARDNQVVTVEGLFPAPPDPKTLPVLEVQNVRN
jgi:cation transport ATPase